jgi:hypothetical protein
MASNIKDKITQGMNPTGNEQPKESTGAGTGMIQQIGDTVKKVTVSAQQFFSGRAIFNSPSIFTV